ncbi:sulfite exporter TauE/SafE family protein [Variovorax dokdonensis]|uniref:Probable membrane transporter protein n=1 Tax=Variovorax dokdonensis TaxID=344883 RepID=A0ABT7N523_9BURK|nr:sulfite exporter TauE/SafE family protein [Variovorax dokdonensis]MDM0043044.1 sulfite exporter TauE/SafE family protein [Variovorax dokdonensis]
MPWMLTGAWIVLPGVVLAGALIGATGIGGVLLVPLLTSLGGVPLPQAIAAASLGFALPALVVLRPLLRQPELAARCLPLLAGALAGSACGAFLVRWLPGAALMAGVTALVLFSGWRGLRTSRANAPHIAAEPLPPLALLVVGALVGVGSALTGTGGPVLVLPLLMLLRQPVLFAVVAAQAIQLPVAIAASAVHAFEGRLEPRLALMCGALMLAGSLLGQRAAMRLDTRQLQRLVSALLLGVGLWFTWLLLT